MKYLVTGGAGFIGSHLVDMLLSKSHEVVVIDNFNDYYDVSIKKRNIEQHLKNSRYTLYRANIEDVTNLEQIFQKHSFDVVIHLAGQAGVRHSIDHPSEHIKANVLGTMNVLECMHKYHVPKIIFASSSSVYGNCTAGKFSENLETNPISPYAVTKLAAEKLCYTYHHLYNIQTIILRFFTVYGPRQRPDLAIHKFTRLILEEKPIQIYGSLDMKRDYTYVSDITRGIEKSLDYNETGFEIINLGEGNSITLKEMIQTIEQTLNKKAILEQVCEQAGDVVQTISDNTKALQLLKWQPEVSFKEGIQKFIEWFENIEMNR